MHGTSLLMSKVRQFEVNKEFHEMHSGQAYTHMWGESTWSG